MNRHRRRPPLTEPRRRLAETGLRMARALAAPYMRRHPNEADEFLSAALWGLTLAASDYDPARGVRFITYAYAKVAGQLLESRGRYRYRHAMISLPILGEETLEGQILVRPAPAPGQALDESESFERRLADLPGRQAELCRLVYRDGLEVQEAGRRFGMSRSQSQRCITQARAAVREQATP